MDKKDIEELMGTYGFSLEETHISWVLISDKLVYKIKKPVDFGFLDYSTLDKRLDFCQKEIELNSRLAKDIYLGISKIVQTKKGLAIDKSGRVKEYAVRMKKIPQERMMDVLIEENKINENHIKALAQIIADFHKNAETNSYISSFGSININKQNTDENFQQTKDAVGEYITQHQYDSIEEYTDAFYADNKELFDKRMDEKKVRDCHGDMYSRNICIISEKKIYIYDCIEFNERFRYSDVASDVAFLLMDLENYERYDLSANFLKRYLEFSGDKNLEAILDFYKIYRAYVRGKIAFFQKDTEQAKRYFDLAFGYLPIKYKPSVILMCGLTGSGKSYIAANLAQKIDAVVINSDETRKKLAGIHKYTKDLSDFEKGIYTRKMTEKVYKTMEYDAYDLARYGKNVIIDATYLKKDQRDSVFKTFKRLGIVPVIIFIDVDDKTAAEHFKRRKQEKSVSDGRYEIYEKQKTIFEKPVECIKIDSENDININIEKILTNIRQKNMD